MSQESDAAADPEDSFEFVEDEPAAAADGAQPGQAPWKIMLVDDEPDVHRASAMVLKTLVVDGRPLELIDAYSGREARELLARHPDVALILLDVVMENDRAGLDFVHHVRNELNNHSVQIILITGQPGRASEREVVTEYAIDGYRSKAEMTADKMFFSVYSALRTYQALHSLEENNRTLTETQKELIRAKEIAEHASRGKDQFLAIISHELRTPLNAVIGLSELAMRVEQDTKRQEYLSKIVHAGKSLSGIITDLLDLTNIASGHLELATKPFSLRQQIARSCVEICPRIIAKGLKLEDEVDATLPDVLIGDGSRFNQILHNLLSNAIKFTHKGQVSLRVRPARTWRKGEVGIILEIQDTGMGIRPDHLAHLFEPFNQADATMTRKFGGIGLGLAICQRLAEMMQGSISVESRPGEGSIFRVELWFGHGRQEDLPNDDWMNSNSTIPAWYADTRVLVVEDQAMNREIVAELLSSVGIDAEMAENGRVALDILSKKGAAAFDLVLMDIQMPEMDGITTTRELRAHHRFDALPIIAMTAHTLAHEKQQAREAGMNDHIGKPFETEHFFRTLARWIPSAKQRASVPAKAGLQPPSGATIMVGAGARPHAPPATHAPGVAATPVVKQAMAGTSKPLPSIRGIDTDAGVARFVGNQERYCYWLTNFMTEGPETVNKIREAMTAGGGEPARKAAHAFKGRVGMLGMTELHPVAAALELALKQNEPADALLEKLDQGVRQTCADIHAGLDVDRPVAQSAPQQGALQPSTDTPLQPPSREVMDRIVALLRASDGDAPAAIQRCLANLPADLANSDTAPAWCKDLRQALVHAQNFDYSEALNALAQSEMREGATT